MSRRLRLFVACVSAWMVVALSGAPVAGAHTEVKRATPGPGAQVDGQVDRIELEFLDPIRPGVTIRVADTEGVPVAGLETARLGSEGLVARVGFDALTEADSYVVTYEFTALDGAGQLGSYSFRFTGDGPGSVGLDDPGDAGAAGIVGLVGFVVLAVAAGVVARFRRSAPRGGPAIEAADHGR